MRMAIRGHYACSRSLSGSSSFHMDLFLPEKLIDLQSFQNLNVDLYVHLSNGTKGNEAFLYLQKAQSRGDLSRA
jgi:hypothetical protein